MPKDPQHLTEKSLKELNKKLQLLFDKVADTRPMMAEIAIMLRNDAVKLMTGQRTGRIYTDGRIAPHQASARGEAPRTDRGILRSSVQHESNAINAIAGTRKKYGAILEDQMGRPWMETVQDNSPPGVWRILNRHMREAGLA